MLITTQLICGIDRARSWVSCLQVPGPISAPSTLKRKLLGRDALQEGSIERVSPQAKGSKVMKPDPDP